VTVTVTVTIVVVVVVVVPLMSVRPATADAGAALTQVLEQLVESVPLVGVEPAEDLFGAVPPRRLEAVEQASALVGERHQDRPPVAGVGVTGDEPGLLEGVDHGRDRPGDDVELGGQVGHAQRPPFGGDEAEDPGLGVCQPEGGELDDRPPPQPACGVGEELGELERDVGVVTAWSAPRVCVRMRVGVHPTPFLIPGAPAWADTESTS
jgi:hypothetical protein